MRGKNFWISFFAGWWICTAYYSNSSFIVISHEGNENLEKTICKRHQSEIEFFYSKIKFLTNWYEMRKFHCKAKKFFNFSFSGNWKSFLCECVCARGRGEDNKVIICLHYITSGGGISRRRLETVLWIFSRLSTLYNRKYIW